MNYSYENENNKIIISDKPSNIAIFMGHLGLIATFIWAVYILNQYWLSEFEPENAGQIVLPIVGAVFCIFSCLNYRLTIFDLNLNYIRYERTVIYKRVSIIQFNEVKALDSVKNQHFHRINQEGLTSDSIKSDFTVQVITKDSKSYKVMQAHERFAAIYASRYKKLKEATGL